jgi:hypothetical protein
MGGREVYRGVLLRRYRNRFAGSNPAPSAKPLRIEMSKTLTNRQYYEKVIKPLHLPVGLHQSRDLCNIGCTCSHDVKNYLDHIVEVLNAEFSFFDERYGIKYSSGPYDR